ncbi:MAG: DUF427 domain-containing protein [Microscillaceae bacterium]|jgi:uncharacterized protein (DUF427 family)|nr:DUF427 domain-containing protein [Microscillaceae bacterium]
MKAIWNGKVIAESKDTVVVEGNHYFPADSMQSQYFEASNHQTVCPWKGLASYYHLAVEGKKNENAVWYYAEPKEAASHIKGRVAFWKGVQVVDE